MVAAMIASFHGNNQPLESSLNESQRLSISTNNWDPVHIDEQQTSASVRLWSRFFKEAPRPEERLRRGQIADWIFCQPTRLARRKRKIRNRIYAPAAFVCGNWWLRSGANWPEIQKRWPQVMHHRGRPRQYRTGQRQARAAESGRRQKR